MFEPMITLKNYEDYLNGQTTPDSLFANVELPENDLVTLDMVKKYILRECGTMIPLEDSPEEEQTAITDFFAEVKGVLNRYISALELEYDPIENYNRTEEESYDNGQESETITHLGKRHTESVNGKNTNTHVEGLTTREAHSGQTVQDITRPAQLEDTESFKGFSSGTGFTDGKKTSHQIGVGTTYTETTTTTQDDQHPSVETLVGDDTKPTTDISEGDAEKPTTIDTGHALNENDTVTVKKNKRTLTARGNIGVTTSQQMLESELRIAEQRMNVCRFIANLFKNGDVVIPVYT